MILILLRVFEARQHQGMKKGQERRSASDRQRRDRGVAFQGMMQGGEGDVVDAKRGVRKGVE